MLGRHRSLLAAAAALTTVAALAAAPLTASAGASPAGSPSMVTGPAPGAPGTEADYLGADKTGFGTSRTSRSDVWYTLERGELSEIYYPNLSTPATRDLQLIITDGRTFTERERGATTHRVRLLDRRALVYQQVDTERQGRWRVTKTYVTDPARSTVMVRVRFDSLTGTPYRVFVAYDPDLANNGNDDSGRVTGRALTSFDGQSASALVARPAFRLLSTGYAGRSDGWADLRSDHVMNWQFTSSPHGNVSQTARTTLNGTTARRLVLAVGFGHDAAHALATARASRHRGFASAARAYASGWHSYLAGLRTAPASLRTQLERATYRSSQMVLAASEDKRNPGAFVASPSMPWAWAFNDDLAKPTGAYHLVWPRDLYEIATALIAEGDRAAARRALVYMWTKQQQPDGHLPQNTQVWGTPEWTSVQLDETADPVILAWQLHRTNAFTWRHVRRALSFILHFSTEGHSAPYTQQERWENQSGYSPATIASEIAALICGARIADANGAHAVARHYRAVADDWQQHLNGWTATRNGPYSPKPYYLRLTKDGNPNAGTRYDLGDTGPKAIDQRAVVDPSFLELVRLGVKPANGPVVLNTVKVVDRHLAVRTPNGVFWHRYVGDGYGEQRDGGPWNIGFPAGSRTTLGRVWPIFAGERGEYRLLAGHPPAAQLAAMARAGNAALFIPEQVWDGRRPTGKPGFAAGEATHSATPLAWSHAQFIRLAWSIAAGHPVEQPAVVACRYARRC